MVFLLGYPGVGKRTVGSHLAQLIDAVLVDNQLINIPLLTLFKWDGKSEIPREIWNRVEPIRDAVLGTIEDLAPPSFSFVFTNVLEDDPDGLELYERIRSLAVHRGSVFLAVMLDCDEDEQVSRIDNPDRIARLKGSDPEGYRRHRHETALFQPPADESIRLDTTSIEPAANAERIIEALVELGFETPAVSDEHRAAESTNTAATSSDDVPRPMSEPVIRTERPDDIDAIRKIVVAAFDSEAEGQLVDNIRRSENYIPELALVAELDGDIVGHVMISRVTIDDAGSRRTAHSLAPVAVAPGAQRRGIGGALVWAAIRSANEMGLPLILLEGSPTYYARFGFEHSVEYGIEFDLPDWAPAEAAQVLPLDGYDASIRGRVMYPPAFDVGA